MLVVTTNIQTLQPTSASAFCFLLRTHWRLSASKDRGGQIICSSQEIPLMFDNVGEALVNHPQIYHGWYFYRQNMFGLWMFLMALLTLATQGVSPFQVSRLHQVHGCHMVPPFFTSPARRAPRRRWCPCRSSWWVCAFVRIVPCSNAGASSASPGRHRSEKTRQFSGVSMHHVANL